MLTLLVAAMVGLALAVALFAVWNLVRELGHAETTYRDRPPAGFRALCQQVHRGATAPDEPAVINWYGRLAQVSADAAVAPAHA